MVYLLKLEAVVFGAADVIQGFLEKGAFQQHCHFAFDGIFVSWLQLKDCRENQLQCAWYVASSTHAMQQGCVLGSAPMLMQQECVLESRVLIAFLCCCPLISGASLVNNVCTWSSLLAFGEAMRR